LSNKVSRHDGVKAPRKRHQERLSMARDTIRPKTAKRPARTKSSPEARKLINIALRRYKSERQAARALRLPTYAQLNQMRRGLIRDTPAMKAALIRAGQRAKRAWSFVPQPSGPCDVIDRATVAALWKELKLLTKRFESIMLKED
jgi:hypothetical protein